MSKFLYRFRMPLANGTPSPVGGGLGWGLSLARTAPQSAPLLTSPLRGKGLSTSHLAIISAITITLATTAQAETIKTSVNGLVCAFCATGIEKTFQKQAAVEHIKVDLESKLVTINTKKDSSLTDAEITSLITDAGYTVTDIKREP